MINFEYSPTTEAFRLYKDPIFHILNGFYTQNNWYIALFNTNQKKYSKNQIVIPKLNYREILGTQINEFDNKTYKNKQTQIIKKIQKELINSKNFTQISQSDQNRQKNLAQKEISRLIKITNSKFEIYKNTKFKIKISPTRFGSIGSFQPTQPNIKRNEMELILHIRLDNFTKEMISEMFVSSITYSLISLSNHYKWNETEAISDFTTKFIYNMNDFDETLKITNKFDQKQFTNSQNILMQLNLPTGKPLNYNNSNNTILLVDKDITKELTQYEFILLKTLIQKYNHNVSYDEISEVLYQSKADIKFTLGGINKTAERLRNKIEFLGVPRNSIVNTRDIGYKLVG